MKSIFTLVVGWIFMVLGVAGLALPFLQGVLFLLIGLVILSSHYGWARLLLRKLRQRFPKVAHLAHTAVARATSWMGQRSN